MTSIKKLSYGLLGLGLLSQGYAAENNDENNDKKRKADTELYHPNKKAHQDNPIGMEIETTSSAQLNLTLGNDFFKGEGVPQNFTNALFCYQEAAHSGSIAAQIKLGNIYFYGNGVPINFIKAVEYYLPAAEQRNGLAMLNLGISYHKAGNFPAAIFWLKQPEWQGHPLKNYYGADAYYQQGVFNQSLSMNPDENLNQAKDSDENLNQAIECYQRAIKMGHPLAG